MDDWRVGMYSHFFSFVALTGMTVLLLGLSARRQRSLIAAQQTLAEREEELRTVIEAEPECVKQLAADGTLLSMNRAGLDMIEADSLEQVRGQQVQQLVLPEHRDAFMALTRRVFDGESGSLSFEVQGIKGTRRWLETNATPLRNAQHQIIALLAVTRDISERKEHEAIQDTARRQLETQLTEITQLRDDLKEQSIRDPLTGLYNRRYLKETIARDLARAQREGYSLALVMLDLDHFKQVNDSHGHAAGDAVLKALAAILDTGARDSDMVCRLGGEEFLVVLPHVSPEQACQRAESWRQTLAETPIKDGNATMCVTLSAGIALFPDHGTEFDAVLDCADKAMYRAKHEGRNRVACFAAE